VSLPTEFIADPDAVMLDLQAASGEDAVRALHGRLVTVSDRVVDSARLLDEVLARMRLSPVCIAEDIALPHARTNAVSRLVLAVARTGKPIPFDPQHPKIRLIFLIGTPQSAVTEYLQAVAVLSRVLRHPATRAGLYAASDEAEFRALLSGGVAAHR
jgi:mannitol/fructose-specific phosphotransferase system IIA component (Ntr-type)